MSPGATKTAGGAATRSAAAAPSGGTSAKVADGDELDRSRSGSRSGSSGSSGSGTRASSRVSNSTSLSQSLPAAAAPSVANVVAPPPFSAPYFYPKALLYQTSRGSAMRYATNDESVHSTYGEDDGSRKTGRRVPPVVGRGRHSPLSISLPVTGSGAKLCSGTSDDDDGSGGTAANNDEAADPPTQLLPRRSSVVEFGTLTIREYQRSVGDNPSCSAGPPIGLDWTYNPTPTTVPLSQYEEDRPPRRTYAEMAMPRSVRHDMLLNEWGVSRSDIASAVRENNRIKSSRRRTVNNLDTPLAKLGENVERVRKGTTRVVLGRKKVSEEYEEWKLDVERRWRDWATENKIEASRGMVEEENRAVAAAQVMGAADDDDDPAEAEPDAAAGGAEDGTGGGGGGGGGNLGAEEDDDDDGPPQVVIDEDQAILWEEGASSHGRDVLLVPPVVAALAKEGGAGGGGGEIGVGGGGGASAKIGGGLKEDHTRSLSQSSGSATYEAGS